MATVSRADDDDAEAPKVSAPLSKVERLRIASVIAPTVRRGSARKVTIVAKDGTPVRETTLGEIQERIAQRHEIEFGTDDGKRPKTIVCVVCRRMVEVPITGKVPKICLRGSCRCSRCGGAVGVALVTAAVKRKQRAECAACLGIDLRPKATTVGGVEYPSLNAACLAHGVIRATVSGYMARGMSTQEAFDAAKNTQRKRLVTAACVVCGQDFVPKAGTRNKARKHQKTCRSAACVGAAHWATRRAKAAEGVK